MSEHPSRESLLARPMRLSRGPCCSRTEPRVVSSPCYLRSWAHSCCSAQLTQRSSGPCRSRCRGESQPPRRHNDRRQCETRLATCVAPVMGGERGAPFSFLDHFTRSERPYLHSTSLRTPKIQLSRRVDSRECIFAASVGVTSDSPLRAARGSWLPARLLLALQTLKTEETWSSLVASSVGGVVRCRSPTSHHAPLIVPRRARRPTP
jgi:hypothetical protein